MNKKFIIGLILFGLIAYLTGFFAGILYENVKFNSEIKKRIISIADSEKPIFRIGNETFYISRFDKSTQNLTNFDRCYDDSASRTSQYPIK